MLQATRQKLAMAHGNAQQKIKATQSKIGAVESLEQFSEDTA